MPNFIDSLSEARRRSILTGQPLTQQEINGMGAGYFDSAGAMNARNRSFDINKKNAEDQLAQERYLTEQQIESAKKMQESQMYNNLTNTAVNVLGTNYLMSKPGESLIAKGGTMVGDAISAINPFSTNVTPALSNAVSDATISGLAPEAATTAESGLGGLVAEGGAEMATGTLETATGVVGKAMPWYLVAKAGGKIINSIIDNNPQYKETPFARLGESLDEPLAVEQYWGQEAADYGLGRPGSNRAIANFANPIGMYLKSGDPLEDTKNWLNPNKVLTNEYGDTAYHAANILNPVGGTINAIDDISKGRTPGPSSDNNTNIGAAVLTGGLSLGTFICTELYRQGYLTEDIFDADAKFGAQMDKVEYAWYKTWGAPLAIMMKKYKLITHLVKFFMRPVSLYMAGEMGVGIGSLFGKINFKILQLICRWRMK